MIIGLKATKFIPKLMVDISDDYEVAKTGQFRLELKTKIDAINNSEMLIKDYWELIYDEVSRFFMTFTFENKVYHKLRYYNQEREYIKYLPNINSTSYIVTERERLESPLMQLFINALEFLDYKLLTKILIMVNIVKSYDGVELLINGITGIEMRVPEELSDIVNSKLLGYYDVVVDSCHYIENHSPYSIVRINFK